MSLLYPAEGRNHMLGVTIHAEAAAPTWYIALFEGNYTPQDDDTAANFASRATECTAYDESTRVEFKETAPSGGASNNTADMALFTMNSTKTIYGFAILSAAAKGATTGKLLCIQRLTSPKTYDAGDVVKVPVSLTLQNAS